MRLIPYVGDVVVYQDQRWTVVAVESADDVLMTIRFGAASWIDDKRAAFGPDWRLRYWRATCKHESEIKTFDSLDAVTIERFAL